MGKKCVRESKKRKGARKAFEQGLRDRKTWDRNQKQALAGYRRQAARGEGIYRIFRDGEVLYENVRFSCALTFATTYARLNPNSIVIGDFLPHPLLIE